MYTRIINEGYFFNRISGSDVLNLVNYYLIPYDRLTITISGAWSVVGNRFNSVVTSSWALSSDASHEGCSLSSCSLAMSIRLCTSCAIRWWSLAGSRWLLLAIDNDCRITFSALSKWPRRNRRDAYSLRSTYITIQTQN